MSIRERLLNIITCGLSLDNDIESLRKVLAINLIIGAGSLSLVFLGIVAFFRGFYLLGICDLFLLIFMVSVHFVLRRSKNYQQLIFSGVITYGIFLCYLFASGGINNTAYVWVFTYPIMALYLGGARQGSIVSFLLLSVMSTVYVLGNRIPLLASYEADLSVRVISAYVTIYLFALLIEKIRVKVQSKLEESNKALAKTIAELEKTNKDREILLKEIHHRVKNNFTIVTSLLNIEAEKTEEESARNVLLQSRSRIRSMALIHEQLYKSDSISDVDLSKYLQKLINTLVESYKIHLKEVTVEYEIEELEIGLNKAIPCGLIVNELVSNTLKHAFDQNDTHKDYLRVLMKKTVNNLIHLEVEDNGIGIPNDVIIAEIDSLGLKLVKILCEEQLEGNFAIDTTKGTKVTIEFKA